jgi:hypothetical protein
MKRIFQISTLTAALLFAFTSCEMPQNENGSDENTMQEDSVEQEEMMEDDAMMEDEGSEMMMEKDGITVSAYTDSPKFESASLKTKSPTNEEMVEPGMVSFDYTVEGYELGKQTSDASSTNLANSAKGQHIHAILNNKPYMAHYKPGFEKELEEGNYVLLSFLSRSYHMSLKNKSAMDIIQFKVGESDEEMADLSAPHLFYSRPKGTYSGADTEKLLLDFFLVNCELGKDGHKVRATINGTEFMLTEWVPYIVEGLEMGDVTVKIELLDAEGNMVDSPFNGEERTVTLKEGDSM